MDHPRLDFGHGKNNFIFFFKNTPSRPGVCKPTTRRTPWIKPPGRETGLSPSSSVDVRNEWSSYVLSSYRRLWRGLRQKVLTYVFARCRTSFRTWLHYSLRTAYGQHTLHKHTLLFCQTQYPVIPVFERTTQDAGA
jgi:hypothetical protein